MRLLTHMLPPFPGRHATNRGLRNAKPFRKSPLRYPPSSRPDCEDIALGQLGIRVLLAGIVCAMQFLVSHIFRMGCPAEMGGVDAAFRAISA